MGTMKGWETRRLKQGAREQEIREAERGRLLKLAEEMIRKRMETQDPSLRFGVAALREFIALAKRVPA